MALVDHHRKAPGAHGCAPLLHHDVLVGGPRDGQGEGAAVTVIVLVVLSDPALLVAVSKMS